MPLGPRYRERVRRNFIVQRTILLDMLHCTIYTGLNKNKKNKGPAMKQIAAILLILLSASAAYAQAAPQLTPAQQQQLQASIDAYAAQSHYPAQPQAQTTQPATAPAAVEPRPWEYGQSVMTDIRQMNF
jgi:hypothetical protein